MNPAAWWWLSGLAMGVLCGATGIWSVAWGRGWRDGFESHRGIVQRVWGRGRVQAAIEAEILEDHDEEQRT